jgi:hypothetical protein
MKTQKKDVKVQERDSNGNPLFDSNGKPLMVERVADEEAPDPKKASHK